MTFSPKITKRVRTRKLRGGEVVRYTRYVLNFADPASGGRKQLFFERLRDAEARRAELIGQVASGTYVDPHAVPTWLRRWSTGWPIGRARSK